VLPTKFRLMKKNYFSLIFYSLTIALSYAQLGINTTTPKSLLHIESNDADNPTYRDGILIPKVNEIPASGNHKGQTVFLENHPTLPDNFYYWNGTEWHTFLDGLNRTYDDTLYIAYGTGFTSSSVTLRYLNFADIKGHDITGFSVNTDSNNHKTIKIGKSGLYLIDFSSSFKKTGTANRSTYRYEITSNDDIIHFADTSISNETIGSASLNTSFLYQLNENDLIQVKVRKLGPEVGTIAISDFGNHSLILNFLHD